MSQAFLPGNRLDLLQSGAEYFPCLIEAIQAARQRVWLESYIFADDVTGRAVAEALCAAAARGLDVRVLVDGFGARNFREDFAGQLTASGVDAREYRPERTPFALRRHRLRRLHRKLVVVDADWAFVGGINIVDDDNAPPGHAPRFDYAVRVAGPVVAQIAAAMQRLWLLVHWASFRRRPRPLPLPLPQDLPKAGSQHAVFLTRDNLRHRQDIANAYIAALRSAREEVLIANAYFLPGVRFGQALLAAARRGVRVRILLQGQTDHPLMHFATQTLYAVLLRAGVRIFEYKKSFLHAKVAVVDGRWATVGSSNIDPFSLLLAREGNLVSDDPAFSWQLQQRLEHAIADGAQEMGLSQLARQPFYSRWLRWMAYGVVRLLVGLAGYGPKHWQDDEGGCAQED